MRIRRYESKKRKGWQVDFQIEVNGLRERKRLVSPYKTKAQTEVWAYSKLQELEDSMRCARAAAPLLREFAKTWLEACHRNKPSTLRAKELILRRHVLPALGDMPLHTVTRPVLVTFRDGLRMAPKTASNVMTVVSGLMRYAEETGQIEECPRVPRVKVPRSELRFLSQGEAAAIMRGARRGQPTDLVTVLLGLDAGLRRGEMVGLDWGDLDLERRTIRVARNVWSGRVDTTKGGRGRTVPMSEHLCQALLALPRPLRRDAPLLQRDGQRVTGRAVTAAIKRAERLGGLAETGHCHVLRHTLGARLAMAGVGEKTIAEVLGHTDTKTTQRYMHLAPDHVSKAVGALATYGHEQVGQTKNGT